MAEEEAKKKVKAPTAIKRDRRNEKRHEINKSFKSKIRTTVRTFESSLEEKDSEAISSNLKAYFSVMDRAAKRGIYKKGKVDRMKSKFSKRASAA
jgi:small subunit ribosomal protein S20